MKESDPYETTDSLLELLECYLYDVFPMEWVDDPRLEGIMERWKRQSKKAIGGFATFQIEKHLEANGLFKPTAP